MLTITYKLRLPERHKVEACKTSKNDAIWEIEECKIEKCFHYFSLSSTESHRYNLCSCVDVLWMSFAK